MPDAATSAAERRRRVARRCRSQLLTGDPATSVADVVDRLLAVQGQDARGVRLAVRPRSVHLTAADVDHALTVDRSVVITWLNRGTLHLVRSEDYWWLQDLTTPQLATANARRLSQEGVGPRQAERGVRTVEAALTNDGPLTRDELRDRLVAANVPVAGQALVHVLMLASLRGLIVRGPMVDGKQAFVLVRDWLGAPPPAPDREGALAELARRYLVGHGPATDADLARWAGVSLGEARAGLGALAGELIVGAEGSVELATAESLEAQDELPPPRLLGAFDPLIMGWRSRDDVLPVDGGAVTSNGIFRPVALVEGTGVATWSLAKGQVVLGEPFGALPSAARARLETDAHDVVRFLSTQAPGGPTAPTG